MRFLFITRQILLCAILSLPLLAQHRDFETNPLVGTWGRVSLLRNSLSVQPPDAPLYLLFGADGYWSMMEMPDDRPKLDKTLDQMSKEELAKRFHDVAGGWGYYIVKNDIVNRIHNEDIGPGREGAQHIRYYIFEDKVMNLAGTGTNMSPQARMAPLEPHPVSDKRLVGTWERTSLMMDGKNVPPPAPEMILLGEDGWFSHTQLPKNRERISKPQDQWTKEDYLKAYTDVEASRGTYTVEGNKFTRKVVAAIDPRLVGWSNAQEFTLEGENLTVRGATMAGVKVESRYRRLPPRPILSWSVKPTE